MQEFGKKVVDHQNQQVQHTTEQLGGDQNHRKAEHAARNTMVGERTLPQQRRKTYYEQNWKRKERNRSENWQRAAYETEGEEQTNPQSKEKQGQTGFCFVKHKKLCVRTHPALPLVTTFFQFQTLHWPSQTILVTFRSQNLGPFLVNPKHQTS